MARRVTSKTTRSGRPETERFRTTLMMLRRELGWTQDTLAARLGVSRRTVSHWENGYWLPPFKQRMHVLLSLRDVPPEYALEIADSLGVSVTPGAEPLVQPFRDALAADDDDDPPGGAAPPVAPPPRVPPDPTALRAAMDAVVRDAADAMNVSANELRAALARALATSAEQGATLEETRGAVAVKERSGKKG